MRWLRSTLSLPIRKELTLRDGPAVTVRPLERTDGDALQKFFLGIPEEERFFLKYSSARPLLLSPSFDQKQMRAVRLIAQDGAEDGIRTRDPLLGN